MTYAPCCGWWGSGKPELIAAMIDNRTLRSTLESGTRGSYDDAKRRKESNNPSCSRHSLI